MDFQRFDIDGLVLIDAATDCRSSRLFLRNLSRRPACANGIDAPFVQDNHVRSAARGVLRGLHFQVPPRAQGKLVRVAQGFGPRRLRGYPRRLADVWPACRDELSAANWRQLWVPVGFAHGYVTLEADTEVLYKTTDYYSPQHERGLAWDDPALAHRLAHSARRGDAVGERPQAASAGGSGRRLSPVCIRTFLQHAISGDWRSRVHRIGGLPLSCRRAQGSRSSTSIA